MKRAFGFRPDKKFLRNSIEKTEPEEQALLRSFRERMAKPAQHLLELLRLKIKGREYDSVLGDDADGRIPALILSHAMQEIYGAEKKLHTVFVKGGSLLRGTNPFETSIIERRLTSALRKKILTGEIVRVQHEESEDEAPEDEDEPGESLYEWKQSTTHSEEVRAYFERMKPLLGSKTLLVTEEIMSGSTIDILVEHLRSIGIDVDVVSFGATYPEEIEDNILKTPKGFPVFIGAHREGPTIDRNLQGVISAQNSLWLGNDRSGRGHAVRQYYDSEGKSVQAGINASRKAVKELSHILAQKFLSKE